MGYGCSGYRCSGTSVRWGWEHLFGGRPPWGTDVRNGGSAEASMQVYIYYPLSGCVVFSVHSGWCFGVFCDCGWWVFMQWSVYVCVKGFSPHYLKRMCACFWKPVSYWVDNLVPFVSFGDAARLSRWIVVYPPFGVSSSASLHGWWVW